ncbi:hypothetical protein L218DRAFT_161398 [Marasmius fiardii PR-910]|nr:hypothetical protein L218DRAFT_161398 [Marasmius fiardii PR-910]
MITSNDWTTSRIALKRRHHRQQPKDFTIFSVPTIALNPLPFWRRQRLPISTRFLNNLTFSIYMIIPTNHESVLSGFGLNLNVRDFIAAPGNDDGKEVSKQVRVTIAFVTVIFILLLVALYLFRNTKLLSNIAQFIRCRPRNERGTSLEPTATPMTTFGARNDVNVAIPPPAYKPRHTGSVSSTSSITYL